MVEWHEKYSDVVFKTSHCLPYHITINSLLPGRFSWNFRWALFKPITVIDGWDTCCEIALRRMSLDLTDDKSTLVQVMAWCRQAASYYLSQCWPWSLLPYGVARPLWVNSYWPGNDTWHQRSWLTLIQVMACCLMAPSHYLNHCWLLVRGVQWHSPEDSFIRSTDELNPWHVFEITLLNLLLHTLLRSHRIKFTHLTQKWKFNDIWSSIWFLLFIFLLISVLSQHNRILHMTRFLHANFVVIGFDWNYSDNNFLSKFWTFCWLSAYCNVLWYHTLLSTRAGDRRYHRLLLCDPPATFPIILKNYL